MKDQVKQSYTEIFNTLKMHKDVCVFDIESLERKAKHHLFSLELQEDYGLNIDPKRVDSCDWMRFGDYKSIGWWGEKYRRTISWSVDGRQPEDELLLQISFPTGAYIFGGDYPNDFFQKFWLELKSFNPDYTDEANHSVYWKVQNAKEIFNSFENILDKYRQLNREDFNKRRIAQMKEELEKLENKTTQP